MPWPTVQDVRFDFRGGLNSTSSEDELDLRELRRAQNARLSAYPGAVSKAPGSKRIHVTALQSGAAIQGVVQWDAPAGSQVVAVANGKFHHKLEAADEFTAVSSPSLGSTTAPAVFVPWRSASAIVLYVACNGLWKWNGTTLTAVAGGVPAGVMDIALYKLRMFAHTLTKRAYWSKISDPDTWSSPNGGFADVETFDTEGLQRVRVVGSSLALYKEDSIARLTNVDADAIDIDTEAEGVSPAVGLEAATAWCALEEAHFIMSDRGPYLVNESGLQEIGPKVAASFAALNQVARPSMVAGFHRGAHEVWTFGPPTGVSTNRHGYVWDARLGSWVGPWLPPFDVSAIARYERTDGSESLLLGGTDGRVRQADVGTLADVNRDGTGGTVIAMTIELPVLHFGAPDRVKTLRHVRVQADLGGVGGGALSLAWSSEMGEATMTPATVSKGPGVRDYEFRLAARGRRIKIALSEGTILNPIIAGVVCTATVERQ